MSNGSIQHDLKISDPDANLILRLQTIEGDGEYDRYYLSLQLTSMVIPDDQKTLERPVTIYISRKMATRLMIALQKIL